MENIIIQKAELEDAVILAQLAVQMWEDSVSELQDGFCGLLRNEQAAVYIAYVDGKAVGFAQCQLRNDYVEGASSSPVGYLEGIFVLEGYRKRGFARKMLSKCEEWAAQQGCTEFASDCELGNDASLAFHLAAGFTEANRVICFAKKIERKIL